MNLTSLIKEKALNLGYCRAGVTSVDDFDSYQEILDSRGDEYNFLRLNSQKGSRPKNLMPEARSIIVLALDYAQTAFPENLLPLVGRVYQARCYTPLPDSLNGLRLKGLTDFLQNHGLQVNSTLMIPARWAAARAGVANFGRNNFAYVDGVGSFVILYTLLVDQELDVDQPTLTNSCPENCRACIEACPTKSLSEPFKMNPHLCLAFNAWKTQEGAAGVSSAMIPRDIREKMDRHVHGCDICQEVCPRNAKKMKGSFPVDKFLAHIAPDISLSRLINMPEGFFERRVRPIMYNYIKEPKYFQRNAAVALGNSGDHQAIDDLSAALNSSEHLLRAHAAWALGRLGGLKARKILDKALKHESSPEVIQEIKSALAS